MPYLDALFFRTVLYDLRERARLIAALVRERDFPSVAHQCRRLVGTNRLVVREAHRTVTILRLLLVIATSIHHQEVLQFSLLLELIAATEQQMQLEASLRYGHWAGKRERDG